MGGLSLTVTNFIIRLIVVIWLLSLTRSIAIMFCGNLFDKASKGAKSALYPILNLFGMLEVVELSPFLGILLFMPGFNLIVLFLMSLKLGKVFNVSTGQKIGLIFLPIVFYPLVAKSDVSYKTSNDEYLRSLESAKSETIHLLTQEEINASNDFVEEAPLQEIDSIFKSNIDEIVSPEPYKAKRNNTNEDMIEEKESSFDNLFDSVDNIYKFESQQEQKQPETKIETIELVDDIFRPVEKTSSNEIINPYNVVPENHEQQMFTPFASIDIQEPVIIEDIPEEKQESKQDINSLFKPVDGNDGFSTIEKIDYSESTSPFVQQLSDVDMFKQNEIVPSNNQNKFVLDIEPEEQDIFAPIEKVEEISINNTSDESNTKQNKFVLDFALDEPEVSEMIEIVDDLTPKQEEPETKFTIDTDIPKLEESKIEPLEIVDIETPEVFEPIEIMDDLTPTVDVEEPLEIMDDLVPKTSTDETSGNQNQTGKNEEIEFFDL